MEITFGAERPESKVGKVALSAWQAVPTLAGMAGLSAGCVAAAMGGSVLAGAAAVVIGAVAPAIAVDKVKKAFESRLTRIVLERLDNVEKAAEQAGFSRDQAVVGVTQRFHVAEEFGSSAYRYESSNMSLEKLAQWRQTHQDKREGLWISKKSEQEALAKISAPKA